MFFCMKITTREVKKADLAILNMIVTSGVSGFAEI